MVKQEKPPVGVVTHRAGDLFSVETVEPRWNKGRTRQMPKTFNLKFRYNGRDAAALAGGGIYAIHFKGELLYVGIFTGDRKVPFAGNVAKERLSKHLEALTMRGRTVGFSAANYDRVLTMEPGPVTDAVRATTIPRDNGSVRSYPCKVGFATTHWAEMSKVEIDRTVLDGFTFTYGRVGPESFAAGAGYATLKNYINVIEDDLILALRPRCNDRFTRSDRAKLAAGPDEAAWSTFKALVAVKPVAGAV